MRAYQKRPMLLFTKWSGPHSIIVPVKVMTTPAEKPVYLLEDGTFTLAAAGRSVGGSYTFQKVKAGRWMVISIDDTAQYNAVVVDRVVTG